MCISCFFAQVIGFYLLAMSLVMLVHPNRYKRIVTEFLNNMPLIALSGSLSLIFGLVIVVSHNIWVAEWPVVITILGWFTILQAIARLFFPERFAKSMKNLMARTGYTICSWFWLIVAIFLIWGGLAG